MELKVGRWGLHRPGIPFSLHSHPNQMEESIATQPTLSASGPSTLSIEQMSDYM